MIIYDCRFVLCSIYYCFKAALVKNIKNNHLCFLSVTYTFVFYKLNHFAETEIALSNNLNHY